MRYMRRSSPGNASRSRLNPNVHGARGLFAAAIYVFHIVNSGLATYPLLALPIAQFLQRTTEFGVELFFCISGFVIAGTLRRASNPRAFLADRAIRIYPTLWVTIVVIVGLGLITRAHGYEGWTIPDILFWLPANLLALPGVFDWPIFHPAAWSLSYEMAFYVACATGWWVISRGGRDALWPMLPIAIVAVALYPRALLFVAGILVAEGVLDSRRICWLANWPILMLAIFLLTWRGIQGLTPGDVTRTTLFEWASDWRLPLAVIAFTAATLGFAGLARGIGPLGRLLRCPILQYLGTISYSFYLWHPIAMAGVKYEMTRSGLSAAAGWNAQLVFFALALPPSLVAAHISQHLLEHAVGVRLRRRLHHPAPLIERAAPVAGVEALASPTGALAKGPEEIVQRDRWRGANPAAAARGSVRNPW